MLFVLSILLVFILSFALITGGYILLVMTNLIKKKRAEKIILLNLTYSCFVTLVYIFQHMFI